MRIPQQAPTLLELVQEAADLNVVMPRVLGAGIGPLVEGEYLHWDQVRHRTPPADLDRRTWWMGIKLARGPLGRPFPLASADGIPFRYALPDPVLEHLHWIDQHASGEILVTETIRDPGDRRRYLVNSLFEEAITSSQLEGASSTRKVAKEMLRTGRQPRDRSERMILNNYLAMSTVPRMANSPLTPDDVFELHRILVEGTVDEPTAAGRLQRPDEDRVVVLGPDGDVAHVPPPASELPDRLVRMCRFANSDGADGFVHPVVRAILLHLWLAYDHPFEDGNGRTARALFYREMLAQGYWLFEYVTISRLLVKAPMQYARAFLYTETDGFDATYFLLHQLVLIRRAIEALLDYLRRKMEEVRETVELLKRTDLNHRQIALLTHALGHADAEYTFQSHARSHRVVRQSARTDLIDLERRNLLERRRVGRQYVFVPVPDLRARLAGPSG
jgi:Fic family protein